MVPGPSQDWIALIRAIGPVTHKKMSMADLRNACTAAGLAQVRTVLSTGNLLFRAEDDRDAVAHRLTQILARFGLESPANAVFLLTPTELRAAMAAVPFSEAARERPARLLYVATTTPLDAAAKTRIAGWDAGPERLCAHGRGLFVDYAEGIGTSKLTPARLERLLGQPGTGRNWNTLGRLLA